MKALLRVVAAAEAATGLCLVLLPTIVTRLLLGSEVDGVGIAASRVAGLALIGFGVACWPGPQGSAVAAMLTYNTGVTVYLLALGLDGQWAGPLLWPAVVMHAVITVLLAAVAGRAHTSSPF